MRLLEDVSSKIDTYVGILRQAINGDGTTSSIYRRQAREYARNANITAAQHEAALRLLGWTQEEWHDGAKHNVISAEEISGSDPAECQA